MQIFPQVYFLFFHIFAVYVDMDNFPDMFRDRKMCTQNFPLFSLYPYT